MEYYKIPFSASAFFNQEDGKNKDGQLEAEKNKPAFFKSSSTSNKRGTARNFEKCGSLEQSIADNIQLIITTSFGECGYDESFGCSIWENDFENILSNDQWKEKLAKSIKKSVEIHEPRLSNVLVTTEIIQDELKQEFHNSVISRIKRRIDVIVDARISVTNVKFSGTQRVYISPIALD